MSEFRRHLMKESPSSLDIDFSNLVVWYDCKNNPGKSNYVWIPAHTISGDPNYSLALHNNAYWGNNGQLVCPNTSLGLDDTDNKSADYAGEALGTTNKYHNPWTLVSLTSAFTYEILISISYNSAVSSDANSESFFGLSYSGYDGDYAWRYSFEFDYETEYLQYNYCNNNSWVIELDFFKCSYNKINHLVFSKSGGTMKGYLNGVYKASMSVPSANYAPNLPGNRLVLGSYDGSGRIATPCEIYSFRCYNKALSADEVKQTYNFHKDRYNL